MSNGETKRGYYADIRRDNRGTILLAGPYRTYSEAVEALRWARIKAVNSGDPRAWFDSYGCCGIETAGPFPRAIYTPRNILLTRRDRDGFVVEHRTEDELQAFADADDVRALRI